MPIRPEWLAQRQEPALLPDLAIIDPHHHLWDRDSDRYLLDDLADDCAGGHRIEATVFVECMSAYRPDGPAELRPVGETVFVDGIAEQSAAGGHGRTRVAAGIVGFADLTLGHRVEPVLQAHLDAAPARFRGIRHAAGFDPAPGVRNSHTNPPRHLLAEPRFREGFAQLATYNLSFDAWLYHHQIADLTDLARSHPEVTIILDHFGGPLGIGPYQGRRGEIFQRWKTDISLLAGCQNVVAKLGGINMPINGFGWHKQPEPPGSEALAAATRGYYLHTIDSFGPERCMFESNFPVDKVSSSYTVLWNAFKRIASEFSVAEQAALFHDTAARVYRLDPL